MAAFIFRGGYLILYLYFCEFYTQYVPKFDLTISTRMRNSADTNILFSVGTCDTAIVYSLLYIC